MTGNEQRPGVTVVRPGHGAERSLGSIGVVFKLFGEQTNGSVAIVEHPFPVGAWVPPHVHTLEDEYSIVTEGEIGFRSGDDEVVLGPGGYITKPRGEAHAMWNAGREPARMIEVISPAGFEHFFWGVGEAVASGAPDPEEMADLLVRHGLSFPDVPWLDDLLARYGLEPMPD